MPRVSDPDPNELCLARFSSGLIHEGFFEEDGVIWAADGTVLAQSRQLGIVMPSEAIRMRAAHERLHSEAHQRDGGRLRRRIRQGPGRARRHLVRHAGDPAAPGTTATTPSTTTPRAARRRSSLAIGGSGWIDIEGERVDLDGDTFVRVGPARKAQGSYSRPRGPAHADRPRRRPASHEAAMQFTELSAAEATSSTSSPAAPRETAADARDESAC